MNLFIEQGSLIRSLIVQMRLQLRNRHRIEIG